MAVTAKYHEAGLQRRLMLRMSAEASAFALSCDNSTLPDFRQAGHPTTQQRPVVRRQNAPLQNFEMQGIASKKLYLETMTVYNGPLSPCVKTCAKKIHGVFHFMNHELIHGLKQ